MTLIICPECKSEVSDRAATCPQCGYPITESPLKKALDGSVQFIKQNFLLHRVRIATAVVWLWPCVMILAMNVAHALFPKQSDAILLFLVVVGFVGWVKWIDWLHRCRQAEVTELTEITKRTERMAADWAKAKRSDEP